MKPVDSLSVETLQAISDATKKAAQLLAEIVSRLADPRKDLEPLAGARGEDTAEARDSGSGVPGSVVNVLQSVVGSFQTRAANPPGSTPAPAEARPTGQATAIADRFDVRAPAVGATSTVQAADRRPSPAGVSDEGVADLRGPMDRLSASLEKVVTALAGENNRRLSPALDRIDKGQDRERERARDAARSSFDSNAAARVPILGQVYGRVQGAVDNLGQARQASAAVAESGAGAGSTALAGLGTAGAALGVIGAAAGAAASALQGIVSSATKFVEAFAPSTVMVMDQAFQDLAATVGLALEPVIQGVTSVVRDFGSVLLPVMESLRPVVAQVVEVFKAFASGFVRQIQPLLEGLAPLAAALANVLEAVEAINEPFMAIGEIVTTVVGAALQHFAGVVNVVVEVLQPVIVAFQIVGDYLRVVGVVIKAVIQTVVAAFGGIGHGIRDAMQGIRDAFREIIRAGVQLVATFARMAGMVEFLQQLQTGFAGGNRKSTVGLAAATNAQIQSFESLGKSAATAAFTASGTLGEASKQDDYMKTLSEDVKRIAEGKGADWKQIIADGVYEGFSKLPKNAVVGAKDAFIRGLNYIDPRNAF